ncbi:hypothetical protein [Alkaliphilus transvaalensis]|uniref:hypothetical protein n=1 Tax=Alkaliphilus transvaalensis TaxID=114628 RepID=UPI000686B8C7|nr:hypothetical protein [Alkaliphilus transvaalensis]
MEDKVFDLLEKLYSEFVDFKHEVNRRFDEVESRLDKLETRLDKVETRLDKLETRLDQVDSRLGKMEVNQERLEDKVTEVFEAIETLAETNERQHQEILKELKGDIGILQLAVKKKSK